MDRQRIEQAWKKIVIEPDADGPYCLLWERRRKPRTAVQFHDPDPMPFWLDIREVIYGCR